MKQTERWAVFAAFQFTHAGRWPAGVLALLCAGQLGSLWWLLHRWQAAGFAYVNMAGETKRGMPTYTACIGMLHWEWMFWLAAAGILAALALSGLAQQRGSAQHQQGLHMLPVAPPAQIAGRFTAAFLWVLLLWTVQLGVTAAGWALYCRIVPSDLVAPAGQFLAFLQGWLWRLYPVQDLSALLGTVLLLVLMACCAAGAQTTFLYRGTRGGDSLSLVWAVAAVPVAWNLPLVLDNRYFFTGITAAVLAAVLLLDALKRCREVEEA